MKNKFLLLLVVSQVTILSNIIAQSVAINSTGATPDASAMLDVSSTTKGLLIPRMTTVQLTAMVLPATGLLVYDATVNLFKTNIGTPAIPSWASLLPTLTGSASLDFASTNALTSKDLTIPVSGATDGDAVSLGVSSAAMFNNAIYSAFVSAPGIVTVRFNNTTLGTLDPPSATFKVSVIKF